MSFLFFWLAVALYIVFLATLYVLKTSKSKNPFRAAFKMHSYFVGAYVILGAGILLSLKGSLFTDFAIGLLTFLLFHYTAFTILYGQVTRGFSLNLCVVIFQKGGSLNQTQLIKELGISENLQEERLSILTQSPVAKLTHGKIKLTPLGKMVNKLNKAIHWVWNIHYLGER